MSDAEDAMRALAEVVPIGLDHPQVQQFADAVAADLALRTDGPVRPSPEVHPSIGERVDQLEAGLAAVTSKLDEILTTLRGGGNA